MLQLPEGVVPACAVRVGSRTARFSLKSQRSELPHHVLPESVDHPLARERDQGDLARLAGLEAHRRAGGDVEPHAPRPLAIELQRRIGLEEMIMRADLDRPVAGIGDRDHDRLAAGIEFDLAVLDEHLAGDHVDTSYGRALTAGLGPAVRVLFPGKEDADARDTCRHDEGEYTPPSPYRLVHSDELRSVRERRLDLDVVDH